MPTRNANQKAGYHSFTANDASDFATGSFEVFWYEPNEQVQQGSAIPDEPSEPSEPLEEGWYWWPCFPGCLPDGEPTGPFDTSTQAFKDANNF